LKSSQGDRKEDVEGHLKTKMVTPKVIKNIGSLLDAEKS
jgi:hypothetical protein